MTLFDWFSGGVSVVSVLVVWPTRIAGWYGRATHTLISSIAEGTPHDIADPCSRTLLALLLLVMLAGPTLTHGESVKVPFLFSEDDKIPQTELHDAMPPSTAVADNQFLNAPLTRLDYMLMQLEARLNEEQAQSVYVVGVVKKAFDPHQVNSHIRPPSVKGYARYDQKRGRVLVGWKVDDLGRPRVPMRATCDEILKALNHVAPQDMQGYLWHNTVLGVLSQGDDEWYTPTLALMARSVVHRVSLQSRTEGFRVNHTLACQRAGADTPIVYQRYSFKVSDRR